MDPVRSCLRSEACRLFPKIRSDTTFDRRRFPDVDDAACGVLHEYARASGSEVFCTRTDAEIIRDHPTTLGDETKKNKKAPHVRSFNKVARKQAPRHLSLPNSASNRGMTSPFEGRSPQRGRRDWRAFLPSRCVHHLSAMRRSVAQKSLV